MPFIQVQDRAAFMRTAATHLETLNATVDRLMLEDLNTAPAREEPMEARHCDYCNSEIPADKLIKVADGDSVCEQCLSDNYILCENSQQFYPTDECGTLYDGESSYPHRDPRTVYLDDSDHFSCEYCDDLFYGSGILLEDSGGLYCQRCANNHAAHCGECGNYYSDDLGCDCESEREYDDDYDADPASAFQVGTDFSRFSERVVGLELETGRRGNHRDFIRAVVETQMTTWGAKSDGSLRDGGYEFVSPPMSGNVIEHDYLQFVRIAKDHDVNLECKHAGYHVHVNAKDIYRHIRVLYSSQETEAEADKREDIILSWGGIIEGVVQEYVSLNRRHNDYCNGDFGTRGCQQHDSLAKVGGSNYPAVAVRDNTFEFRIFPSTYCMNWHLARIEFSQKSVDFLYKLLTQRTVSRAKAALALMKARLKDLRGAARVRYISRILGLTGATRISLRQMHAKYNPVQYIPLPAQRYDASAVVNSSWQAEPEMAVA